MEYVIYSIDGVNYTIKKDQVDTFLANNPNAVLVSGGQSNEEDANFPTGTPDVGVNEVPAEQNLTPVMVSPSENISSGSQEDKYGFEEPFQGTFFGDVVLDFFGDIGRAFESGAAAGMSVDEAFDIYKQGASISDDDLDAFIAADKRIQAKGTSDEMLEYQKLYEEAGGGILGFIIANAKTRGQVLPQIIVSSIATMATSLESGEVRTAAAAGAGTGALVGSVATPIGTVTGAVGGGVAGLVGAMETSLTLSELLKEEIGSGELTKENIRAVLQDPEKLNRIKNKSIGRGIAIGAIEGITLGLSRGLATQLTTKGMKAGAVSARVAGLEAIGGSTGEIAGRVAAGQEMDASDILFEGVAELKGVVNVADIVTQSKYKINGETRKRKDVQKFLSTATDLEIAGANIDIQNDANLQEFVRNKQMSVSMDAKFKKAGITDVGDRANLIRLEKERLQYVGGQEKTIKNNLADIDSEIKLITDKYKRRGPKTAEQKATIAESEAIEKAVQDRSVAKTIEFAETEGKRIGLKTEVADDTKSFEAILKKDGIKLTKDEKASIDRIGGFIQGDKIYINKDVAGKTGQINVGGHELLHGIIESADIKDMNVLVDDFKKQLSQDQLNTLEAQMEARGYTVDSETYAKEYLTNFSDAIADGSIKFNENVFTKIGDAIVSLLKIFGYENINFKDGKGVYNFMKEYSQNVKEGKLSDAVIQQAGGKVNAQRAFSVSPEKAKKVNDLYKNQEPGFEFNIVREYTGMAETYLNDFLKNPNLSEEQKAIIQRNREDISAMMLYDKIPTQRKGSKLRNVMGLVQSFDEVKNQYGTDGVAGYINKFFRTRGLEAINYYLKDSGLKSVETEDGSLRKDIKTVADTATNVLDESGPRQGQAIRKDKEDKSFERKITLTELAKDILTDPTATLEKVTSIITKELKLLARGRKINIENVEKVIQKEVRKVVIEGMGKISSEKIPGSTKRRAVIPVSYSTTIETKFNEIADAMSLSDIKKRYNKLFKVTDTGKREKTAEGNPIFEIGKPIKAEFIKYFTDTNIAMTTLVERQKMLGEIMTKAIVSKMLKEYNVNENLIELAKIANLNPAEGAKAVTELQLENEINDVAKQLDTYEGEKLLQDTRLFSIAPGKKEKSQIVKLYKTLQNEKSINSEVYIEAAEKVPNIIRQFVENLYEKRGKISGKRIGGVIYEKLLLKAIADAGGIFKILNNDNKKSGTAEYSPSSPDIQMVVGEINMIVEAKLSATANFGTTTISNVNLNTGEITFSDKEFTKQADATIIEDLVKKSIPILKDLIEEVENELNITINKTNFPKSFRDGIKKVFGNDKAKRKAFHEKKLLEFESHGRLIKLGEVLGPEIITEGYRKKGVKYIQIGSKGLYHFGANTYELGTDQFTGSFNYPLRLKPDGAYNYSFSIEPKMIEPGKLKPSPVSLENTKDLKNIGSKLQKSQPLASRAAKNNPNAKVGLDKAFNDILEEKTGIASNKVYSKEKARMVGRKNKRRSFYIAPSAEDFVGLMYKLLSKGRLGDAQMAWIKKHILNPYAKAMDQLARERVVLMHNFRQLKKNLKNVPKKLKKEIPGEGFTYQDAVRVYMWNKQGMEIPGLTKAEIKELVSIVKKDKELVQFGNELIAIHKGGYPAPQNYWTSGTMTTDMLNGLNTTRRSEILSEWQANVDEIFSEKNLNKLEAQFGDNYREALENILGRMKTGRNRPVGGNKIANAWLDWINGSVGVVMFLNMRSALLQTISMVNYINWNDNNILAAGKAFANQKQYWADFKMIWNSDFLTTRRGGLQLNVSENEIADMANKGGVRGVVSYLLKLGFTPTKIADSFAIASGGASMYRNRIDTYKKQGFSQEESETLAFKDFQELTEEAQQSSRPDRISKQQASSTGRLFLAWANTPMQYGRLIKRSIQDLAAGRGDRNTNISKAIYYSSMQNFVFNFMQKGAFALAFGQEEDTEKEIAKYAEVGESMVDSVLRGSGIQGNLVVTAKSLIKDIYKKSQQARPNYEKSLWKLGEAFPPLDSKLDRARGVAYAFMYEKEAMEEEGLTLENPAVMAGAQALSFAFNLPLDRALRKFDNLKAAMDDETELWQSIALLLGWSEWSLGMTEDETAPTKNSSSNRKNRNRKNQKRK